MKLNQKTLTHNSGGDLWDHFFYKTPLKYVYSDDDANDDDSFDDDPNWLVQGLEWLDSELGDGEEWDYYDGDDQYIYTSMARLANLKKQLWRRTQFQGSIITAVVKRGGISVDKLVKQRWGIKVDYYTLPDEVKKYVNADTYLKKLEKKRK